MGKKSKRNRPSRQQRQQAGPPTPSLVGEDDDYPRRAHPSKRQEQEETLENLRFQDPYVEEQMDEDDEEENGDDGFDNENEAAGTELVKSWHPLMGGQQPEDLEMDPAAYKMYHSLTPEFPALSFDFLRDDLGAVRTRFPHTLTVAVGTQADKPQNNKLTIMKLRDLAKLPQENDDDILGDEYGKEDDSSSSDEEEDLDLDPTLEHFSIPHHGGINRVRSMPSQPEIIATWSDAGRVNLFNVKGILERFETDRSRPVHEIPRKPFFSHEAKTEGYSLDWSTVQKGNLVSGDCSGTISLWNPGEGDSYTVNNAYEAKAVGNKRSVSVEDLQWSPTEATVFAAATCEGYVQIYDTRAPGRVMLSHKIHANGSDVNVISWNPLVSNLLASGSDDGVLSVWDLRHFSGKKVPDPLARFTAHQTPITSVEWHPTDESMIGVTDEVGAYVYDLSVEEDTAVSSEVAVVDIPPQLLFAHAGSQLFKELHWHPQISSCIMTTALTGFSVFIPSNL